MHRRNWWGNEQIIAHQDGFKRVRMNESSKRESKPELVRKSFVRFLMLAIWLRPAKVYFMIYVVDLTIGIYSFLTSFVLFNIILLSYFR